MISEYPPPSATTAGAAMSGATGKPPPGQVNADAGSAVNRALHLGPYRPAPIGDAVSPAYSESSPLRPVPVATGRTSGDRP